MKFKYNIDVVKKKSLRCIEIPVDIYRCRVVVIMPKEAKQLNKDWERGNSGGETINYLADHNEILIILTEVNNSTISHEFLHATQIIMDWIGHKQAGWVDEPSAYLLGYLVEEFEIKRKLYKK